MVMSYLNLEPLICIVCAHVERKVLLWVVRCVDADPRDVIAGVRC